MMNDSQDQFNCDNPAELYMEPDYYDSDDSCPRCGHYPTRYRHCCELGCDDGFIDLYDEDPLWYDPDDFEVCEACNGTGVQRWCPSCGLDLQQRQPKTDEQSA